MLFTVVFDEPIKEATFTSADVSIGGTATTGAVTVTEIAPNDDTTFSVSIEVSGDGTAIPTIPAGGIEDPAGNTNTASTSSDNSVTVDTAQPEVQLVTVGDSLLTDGDTGLVLGVIFSEPMDTGVLPILTFSPDVATTLTLDSSLWLSDDSFQATFDVADANVNVDSVTADVAGARDPAGNPQADYAPLHGFEIDMLNPVVASVTVSDDWLDELDDGGTFTVTVDFAEPMTVDGSADPAVAFTPVVATTLLHSSAAWLDANTYQVIYDIDDSNTIQPDVDVGITGGKDALGNDQVAFDDPDRFDIDMITPPPGTVVELSVLPGGVAGGFLDRCLELAEGEEPPMIGDCPLAAAFECGEMIGGSCLVCGPCGETLYASYVHVYVYAVDVTTIPPTATLIDHWSIFYDPGYGAYPFSWDSTDMAPGYYDIYLSFADGSDEVIRIHLIEPVS